MYKQLVHGCDNSFCSSGPQSIYTSANHAIQNPKPPFGYTSVNQRLYTQMLCDCSCEPKNPGPKVIISGSSTLAIEKCTKHGQKLSRHAPYKFTESTLDGTVCCLEVDGISKFEKSKRALTSQAAGCGNWIRQVSNCALLPLEKSSFLIRASSPTRNSSQVCVWHLFRKGGACLNFLLLPQCLAQPTSSARTEGKESQLPFLA